jgi:stage V sporulation protein B
MVFGEIINLAILAVAYKYKSRNEHVINRHNLLEKRNIFKELIATSVPISVNRFIISAISAFENILIPKRLLAGGMAYSASLSQFGRMTGMAMPILFFPALITSSLAVMLVPTISEMVSIRNNKPLNYKISKSIQLTITLGFIFSAIFVSYSEEIGKLIYRRESVGDLIYTLSFSCVFLYLQQTLLGILNGLDKQNICLRIYI